MNQTQLDRYRQQFRYTREMLDRAYRDLGEVVGSTALSDTKVNTSRNRLLGAWRKLDRLEQVIVADFETPDSDTS